tara:strand:+ start:247 stop:450 length:204 start_codon:yes stop_codon:yes gene_type:complete
MNKADNYDAPIFADGAFNKDNNKHELNNLGLLGIVSYTQSLAAEHIKEKLRSERKDMIFNQLLSSIR